MVKLDRLDAESILSEEIFEDIFDEADELARERLVQSIRVRAEQLRVLTSFNRLYRIYKKIIDGAKKKVSKFTSNNMTEFSGPYESMNCRGWIATDEGIYVYNPSTGYSDILACYHPILPIERFKNLETGEEQIKIAYKRNFKWEEIIVPKSTIASASKIVGLSSRGIAVTSENAKYLVRYLSDVENANEDIIKVQESSSKLGWIKDVFLPYDTSIAFDGDARYKQMYQSVQQEGSREKWYSFMKKLRKEAKVPLRLLFAASFASVLIKLVDGLPFFIDLWGRSGTGKTVALMVAASIWANPGKGMYIKDYESTDVGFEALSDFLNNLPLILDDTSKKSKITEKDFEKIVYALCSGKGKTRSTKELGLNQEKHWENCILTTGEHPLRSYVQQSGAINRIIEVECNDNIFSNVLEAIEVTKFNYGFAGKDFVELIGKLGIDVIREIQKDFLKKLSIDDEIQKQSLSLSIVLTADKIISEYLFQDNITVSISEAKEYIVEREDLSEGERCYKFLLDKIEMNPSRFDDENNVEQWGVLDKGPNGENIAFIIPAAFTFMCNSGGFNESSFMSWAKDNNCIVIDEKGGKTTRIKRIKGKVKRCVWLKILEDEEFEKAEQSEFKPIKEVYQEELPFK